MFHVLVIECWIWKVQGWVAGVRDGASSVGYASAPSFARAVSRPIKAGEARGGASRHAAREKYLPSVQPYQLLRSAADGCAYSGMQAAWVSCIAYTIPLPDGA